MLKRLINLGVLSILLCFAANKASAQSAGLQDYQFSYFHATYGEMTGGTVLWGANNTYTSSATVTLPFPISLDGKTSSSVLVHASGIVTLNEAANGLPCASGTSYSTTTPFTSNRPSVFGFQVPGYTGDVNGSVTMGVIGNAPNRVLILQFKDRETYSQTTASLNYQIRFYETSNIIEFWYGSMNFGNHNWAGTGYLYDAAVGLSGCTSGNYINIGVDENGQDFVAHKSSVNPAPINGDRSVTAANQGAKFTSGLVLRFAPLPLATAYTPAPGFVYKRNQIYAGADQPSIYINRASVSAPEVSVRYKISGPMPETNPDYKVIYEAVSTTDASVKEYKLDPQPVGTDVKCPIKSASGIGAGADGILDLSANWSQIIPGDYKVEGAMVLPTVGNIIQTLPTRTVYIAMNNDAGISSINLPQRNVSKKYPVSAPSIPVQVVIKNLGDNAANNLNVNVKIYNLSNNTVVYNQTKQYLPPSVDLVTGKTQVIDFPSYTPTTTGDFKIIAEIAMTTVMDENVINNTLPQTGDENYVFSVVNDIDLATSEIIAPKISSYVNYPIRPIAKFANFGVFDMNNTKAVIQILQNGALIYTDTVNVNIPASGISSAYANFVNEFIPTKLGIYNVIVSIMANGDGNVANNELTASFEVLDGMKGTYTISALGSGNRNFTDLTSAVNSLYEKGVTGPVSFELTDDIYVEGNPAVNPNKAGLDFRSKIIGASSTNEIKFVPSASKKVSKGSISLKLQSDLGIGLWFGQSITPQSPKAPVMNASAKNLVNYANSEGYITFDGGSLKSIRIQLETNSEFRAPVYLASGAKNIGIKNCIIENANGANISYACQLPLSSLGNGGIGFAQEPNKVDSRTFSAGILIRNIIPANEIDDISYNQFKLDTVVNQNNNIISNEISGFAYGVADMGIGILRNEKANKFMQYFNRNNVISHNTIYNVAAAGIFVGFEENTEISHNRIYNISGDCGDFSAGIISGGMAARNKFGYYNIGLNIIGNEISNVSSNTAVYGIYAEQSNIEIAGVGSEPTTIFPTVNDNINISANAVWGLNAVTSSVNRNGIVLMTERDASQTDSYTRYTTPKRTDVSVKNNKILNNTIIIDGDGGVENTGFISAISIQQAESTKSFNNALVMYDNEFDASNPLAAAVFVNGKKDGVSMDRNAFQLPTNMPVIRFIERNTDGTVANMGNKDDFMNLNQWYYFSGSDKNSFTADIMKDHEFVGVNPAALRIKTIPALPKGSLLNNRGDKFSEVSIDLLGNPRGASNQRYDIGAFEFDGGMYQIDLAVLNILAPGAYKDIRTSSMFNDAEYVMTEAPIDVVARIRNNGTMTAVDREVKVEIYRETPAGTFASAPIVKTAKATVSSTNEIDLSFGLADGKNNDDFVPVTYGQLELAGYTVPEAFKSMKSTVTPRYKFVVTASIDEVNSNNTNTTEKIVRFFVKKSGLSILLSTENSHVNIGNGNVTPSVLDQDNYAGRLNADTLLRNFADLGWKLTYGEDNHDIDLIERNSWEPRSIDYTIYRSLFWSDGNDKKLTDQQVKDLTSFVNSGTISSKKNLIIGSQEIVRENTVANNKSGSEFVNNILRAENKTPGLFAGAVDIKGVSLARNIVMPLYVTGFTGDAAPQAGLMSIANDISIDGLARIAYYYDQPVNTPVNDKIAGITVAKLTSNIITLGLDWRHFANAEAVLRAASDFIENNGGKIVPVELLDFTAEKANSRVELSWATSSEVNSSRFEVEKALISEKKISTFEKIDEKQARGNSSVITNYGPVLDKNVISGNTYVYRLKMIDADGEFNYSDEKTVTIEGNGFTADFISVNPNPVKSTTTIEYYLTEETNVTLTLVDINGKELLVLANGIMPAGQHKVSFDASNTANGVYNAVLKSIDVIKTISIHVSK